MFNLKKKHFKSKLLVTRKKIWDLEFMLDNSKEMREGFRMEHDRLNEQRDAAKRRLYTEKYNLFYADTKDPVDIMNISLPYSDIDALPSKPEGEWRFYKEAKPNPDKTVCDNLENLIKKVEEGLEEKKKQMDVIDEQINGEGGVLKAMEGYQQVIEMLKKTIKKV